MRSFHRASVLSSVLFLTLSSLAVGCSSGAPSDSTESTADELRGPGKWATDTRVPELGSDLRVLQQSQVWMDEAIEDARSTTGTMIEAKFELDDQGKLSLSLYPAGKSIRVDAERNVFQELAGDPTASPFAGSLEVFKDQEHLTRSARDLTLVQLSRVSLLEAVERSSCDGFVFWAIPTVRHGRAGYGVYTANGKKQKYRFIDGDGSSARTASHPTDLGAGPGARATDERTPELGSDLSVLKTAKVTMAQALASLEEAHGPTIEAKYELDGGGKLSLSVYPVKDIALDAERCAFGELAGDPTTKTFNPSFEEFKVPDVEHLTRSARDITIVQTASLTLRQAVDSAQKAMPGGFVYWAIPTIRDTRAGYGIYVYGTDGKSHYFFIS